MINSHSALASLGNAELLASTRDLLRRVCVVEADLLVHLVEIEDRSIHYEMADGFARTRAHDRDRIVLRCRGHDQHAAEKMYGRAFMERARASGKASAGAPRCQERLL